MKEQLITFETAKLAKEKGFNINVTNFYDLGGKHRASFLNADLKEYFAPTQSLLQKWLREKHNIDISILIDEEKNYFAKIHENLKLSFTVYSDTYENALELALHTGLLTTTTKLYT